MLIQIILTIMSLPICKSRHAFVGVLCIASTVLRLLVRLDVIEASRGVLRELFVAGYLGFWTSGRKAGKKRLLQISGDYRTLVYRVG